MCAYYSHSLDFSSPHFSFVVIITFSFRVVASFSMPVTYAVEEDEMYPMPCFDRKKNGNVIS